MKLNKRFKLIITALLLAVLLLITTSCGLFNDYPDYYEIFGTVFTVTSDGGKAMEKEVAALLSGKESLLSTQISSSDIFKINAAPAGTAVKVDALTFSLLELSAELYASSVFRRTPLPRFRRITYFLRTGKYSHYLKSAIITTSFSTETR